MNRKIRTALVLLVVLIGGSAFANGTREQAPVNAGTGIAGVQTSTAGVLDITDGEVLLVTDEGTYTLSTQGGRLIDLSDKDGEQVEINGILSSCETCVNDYDGHLFVTSAAIDGEPVVLDSAVRSARNNRTMTGTPFQTGGKNQNTQNNRMQPRGNSRAQANTRPYENADSMNRGQMNNQPMGMQRARTEVRSDHSSDRVTGRSYEPGAAMLLRASFCVCCLIPFNPG